MRSEQSDKVGNTNEVFDAGPLAMSTWAKRTPQKRRGLHRKRSRYTTNEKDDENEETEA